MRLDQRCKICQTLRIVNTDEKEEEKGGDEVSVIIVMSS